MLDREAIVGVLLCILGGIVDNLGVTVQKLSHRRRLPGHYCTKRLWLVGVSMYLLGNVCNGLGLSLAPQSDVAAVGSLTLVWNACNSYFFLEEGLNKPIIAGISIVLLGSLTAVAFGSPSPPATMEMLLQIDCSSIIYMITVASCLSISAVGIRMVQRKYQLALDEKKQLGIYSVADPLLVTNRSSTILCYDDGSNALTKKKAAARFFNLELFLAISIPTYTGVLGSFTVLFAKTCAVLVRTSFSEHGFNQFKSWPLYLAVILTLLFGALQIHLLNVALRSHDQLIVVPAFAVSLEAFNILGGMIVFKDGASLSKVSMVLFICCVSISFLGVGLIVYGLRRQRIVSTCSGPPTPTGSA
uniref:Magnesium transporter n=2 Tax=Spongospora subterranea TaxID=70186 RepID=A0A0H5RA19_9EUKA|eukprot:CRZ10928.1 hypothetical protein [Spongospora subterranea]